MSASSAETMADLVLTGGRIATLDPARPSASALAIRGGAFVAVGSDADVQRHVGPSTRVVKLGGRTVIPGLVDSHIHTIRGGLNYNMELRWDGVPSLADALRLLREQAQRTPAPQWVRVVGGWTEFQFAERRMPTLAEINAAAPDTPVFILYLYGLALLNAAALRVLGYDRNTPNPPGGEIQHDAKGDPTGLLIAKPSAMILYSTLARGPKLGWDDQVNSSRHFMRELNHLGLTSVIDAGGGFQNYPEDYKVIEHLHGRDELTLRIAYNLFTQRPGQELDDFRKWTSTTKPGQGDDFYKLNGAGEMLVYSAADFENFLEPRPDLPASLEDSLHAVVRHLVEQRWPFRLHATYDESIRRFLDVFERVNREVPFAGLRWWFDHAETATPASLERTAALGGGIAVQSRMAFQGEHFIKRYGTAAARHTPPIRRMLDLGIPVGAGTDATRVASYNPWVALYWMVTGKSVGGTQLAAPDNRLSRTDALRLYTQGSAWFSGEADAKGTLAVGRHADLAVLSADYFSVPEESIKRLESVLTVVGGRIVHGADAFASHAPPLPPASPDWSPTAARGRAAGGASSTSRTETAGGVSSAAVDAPGGPFAGHSPWDTGCACFVF